MEEIRISAVRRVGAAESPEANEILSQVVALNPKIIVPGHGAHMGIGEAAAMQRRMAALYAGVEVGCKKGFYDSEIRGTLDVEEWAKMHISNKMGEVLTVPFLKWKR